MECPESCLCMLLDEFLPLADLIGCYRVALNLFLSDPLVSTVFRPYNTSTSHPTDNATPMKEHPTPSSLTLNTSVLNSKRKKMGPPKYTTPLPSPAVTIPSSPAIKQSFSQGHVSFPPSIQPSSVPPTPQAQGASPRPGSAKSKALYDKSRIANLKKGSREDEKGFCKLPIF